MQRPTGRKREEDENSKLWICWERKEPLDEKKAFFIVLAGLSFDEKIKNSGHKLKNAGL